MSKSTAAPAPEATTDAPTLVHVDPATLVLATNVRTDARLDAGFLASIRERGVLVPVVAHRTDDGALAVLMGQRRTLAAVETARPTVPVLVVADLAEADRLVDQMGENDHRAALTTGERVAAFAQLSALGVSAAQIAKRTATKRVDVDAALTVAASGIATGAAERWDFLTLDQSAVLADFEDEPETIKALVAAASTGQFDHVAQRARDARALRRQGERIAADLTARGVAVIDRPPYDGPSQTLNNLLDADGEVLTPETHATCPGQAAYLHATWTWTTTATTEGAAVEEDEAPTYDDDEGGWDEEEGWGDDDEPDAVLTSTPHAPQRERVETMTAYFVCTDFKAHGHTDRYGHLTSGGSSGSTKTRAADMSETEREQAKAERRDVIESNRAWKSAEAVRRAWLRTFATRKTAPKDAPQFIAATLAGRIHALTKASESGNRLALDLLGVQAPAGLYSPRPALVDDKTTGPRAQVLTLVLLLAAVEEGTGTHSWRNVDRETAAYLRFIEANGYALSDVERRACGQDPLPVDPDATTDPVDPDEADEADDAGDDAEDEAGPSTD